MLAFPQRPVYSRNITKYTLRSSLNQFQMESRHTLLSCALPSCTLQKVGGNSASSKSINIVFLADSDDVSIFSNKVLSMKVLTLFYLDIMLLYTVDNRAV